MVEWEKIIPKVNESAEFLEIASDFGDPLELFREALHNACDQEATEFKIIITVSEIRGQDKLVIELIDKGTGMSRDTIINHFIHKACVYRAHSIRVQIKNFGIMLYFFC